MPQLVLVGIDLDTSKYLVSFFTIMSFSMSRYKEFWRWYSQCSRNQYGEILYAAITLSLSLSLSCCPDTDSLAGSPAWRDTSLSFASFCDFHFFSDQSESEEFDLYNIIVTFVNALWGSRRAATGNTDLRLVNTNHLNVEYWILFSDWSILITWLFWRKFDASRRRVKVKTVNNNTGEADMETRKREDTGHISFQIPSLNWRWGDMDISNKWLTRNKWLQGCPKIMLEQASMLRVLRESSDFW